MITMSTPKKIDDNIKEIKDLKDDEKTDGEENYLVTYTRHLERRLRSLEAEKQVLESERIRLEKELHTLRMELDRLKQPPLIAAQLTDILDDNRAVVKSSTGPVFVVNISRKLNTSELESGMRVALNQRTFAIVEVLPECIDPLVQGMELLEDVPDLTYEDIGGLDEQLNEVREAIELPLLKPQLFESVGIIPPKGVLLYGEPGTGKTLTAKVIAHETKAKFIRIIGSELVQKFIGEGARMVREVFRMARKKAPAIVFIDELDAIGSKRIQVATSGDREVQRTLMQLLSELDGFSERGNVRIIAATNRPDILDPALLRPGRFDRLIEFPLPKDMDREKIFKIHTRKLKCAQDVNIKALSMKTENSTGADIRAFCVEAGMFAIRDNRDTITMEDFNKAIEKVLKKKAESPNLYS